MIGRNFVINNYYSELLTVIGAMVGRPFFSSPINPLTRFCNMVDDFVVRLVPAAGVYYRSVIIRGTKRMASWAD